jgi:hypothetical protein
VDELFEWPEAAHVYLAPPLDDAVLSGGGLLAQQAGQGESTVVVAAVAVMVYSWRWREWFG